MKNRITLILLALALLGAIGYNVYQHKNNNRLTGELTQTEADKKGLETLLLNAEETIKMLKEKLQKALETIGNLDRQLASAKAENAGLRKTIAAYKTRVNSLENSVEELTSQFKDLADASDEEKRNLQLLINEKVYEINGLKDEVDRMSATLASYDSELNNLQEEKRIREQEIKQLRDWQDIVSNTKLEILESRLTNQNGAEFTSLDTNRKKAKWRNSWFKIKLNNSVNPSLLSGKNFAVKIYDIDNGIVLDVIEATEFDRGKRGKIHFRLNAEDETIEVNFMNYQAKTGKNYSLRLYFLPDPSKPMQVYLCGEGRQFIANREKTA